MKRFTIFAALVLCLMPVLARAHAVPVQTIPESSSTSSTTPESMSIRFSERLDAAASSLTVTGPSGSVVSGRVSRDGNGTQLSAPLRDDGRGTYTVSWSVVSSDDGHFTKGAYAFAIGEGVIAASNLEEVQIVQISTIPEALASAMELFGNGIVWAVMLLFALAARRLYAEAAAHDRRLIERGYTILLSAAIGLVVFGAITQFCIKAAQLSEIRSIPLLQGLGLYALTSVGFATLARMLLALFVAGTFFSGRRRIFAAARITWRELLMIACMLAFALFRAKVSHATANPFHPHLSVAVNFFHLIEKDIWAGIMLCLLLLSLVQRARGILVALIPRAFQMLAIDLAAVSVTAAYIVWLHLKSFSNLFTTAWGGAFLQLLIAAILLVCLRTYHVLARLRAARMFGRWMSATFALELGCALLVIYYSSVVIITSPPLAGQSGIRFSAHDQGISIAMERDPHEDQMILVTVDAESAGRPFVSMREEDGGTLSVELEQRFEGGYVFPLALIQKAERVSITVPQSGGYDAHANFAIARDLFAISSGDESRRPFDRLALSMLCFALAAALFSLALMRYSRLPSTVSSESRSAFPLSSALTALLVSVVLVGSGIQRIGESRYANPFKAECLADGNDWHLMQPTKAGVVVSAQPKEGCMWGMGEYLYMFSDRREYEWYKSLGPADVSVGFAPVKPVAGVPTTITVSLKDSSGEPARLFVDMEKILHMVIISEDQQEFAHIHADDLRPITKEEIDSSIFTFRYTFPKAGRYLISLDYAHGISLESKQLRVDVGGAPAQAKSARLYPTEGDFGGYHVRLDYALPLAGEVTTFKYTIAKNGQPAELVPYLSAAMHIAAVKNDFTWYLHTHGEVHLPGTPVPPILVKDGTVVHTMAAMSVPPLFALPVDAHVIFPRAGAYTIWGQFQTVAGDLVSTAFTVRVE